jgi:hypothetical protein
VVNWLKQFTQTSLRGLMCRNRALLYELLQKLQLRRLTSDLDGTVMRTGDKVAWAMRGVNPHQPKDPCHGRFGLSSTPELVGNPLRGSGRERP